MPLRFAKEREFCVCCRGAQKGDVSQRRVCAQGGVWGRRATLSFFACNECVNRIPPLVQEHSSQQEEALCQWTGCSDNTLRIHIGVQ
jgi:hypothetical protein